MKFIQNFCSNRQFAVHVNAQQSELRCIPAGLPQGSTLSPTLYNIFVSDIPCLRQMNAAYYADDTAIYTSANRTKTICNRLQRALVSVNKYFSKWKISVNPDKTQAIIFPFNNQRKRTITTPIKLNNTAITFSNPIKYLGVTFDAKLNFGAHIKNICAKASRCISSIYPLIGYKSKLNLGNKLLLFKTIVRPLLIYASPIWSSAANCHIKKLQIQQNRCLKIIRNLPRRFSTNKLHLLPNIPLFREYMTRMNDNFRINCINSPIEIIRELF